MNQTTFMPNQLSFDVVFDRDQILTLLDTPGAVSLTVTGTYTKQVGSAWDMQVFADVTDANEFKVNTTRVPPTCIKPC